ncbi:MAG: hypothetical protein IJQ00_14140, partial [Kiritimatiellae bacterium]|nr:hypothetical protein [Kiritimatiellia bacterium]
EIDGTIRDAPPELKENPDVRKALEMVEASALTPEERAKYDGFQDWLCRERRRANAERRAEKVPGLEAALNAANARADAATAERDAAIAKMRQDKLDTARNLKTMNLSIEQIATATGLTAEEIEKL